mgnify:CR=1 FL=1
MALPQAVRMIAEIKARLVEMSGFLVPSGVILMWGGSADTIPRGWALCDGTNGTPDLLDRFVVASGKNYPQGSKGGAASATPDVSTGTAKTGISLASAAPGGTAGSSGTGIGIQNAALNIWTGAAGTGIGIQGTTLDGNTLPSHGHVYHTNAHKGATGFEDRAANGGDTVTANTGNSWGHAHGVSDPGHAHAVGSSEHAHGVSDPTHGHTVATEAHNHTLTDGGHAHTVTAKAISTLPPYCALHFIMKL